MRIRRVGGQIDPEGREAQARSLKLESAASPRCASVSGFSLHERSEWKPDRAQPSSDANTAIHAEDRARLQRLFQQRESPRNAQKRGDSSFGR
jgi:hypothetical protein